MVDDQLCGHQRVDALRVAAQGADGVTHGGQIDHCGDAGEVLHEDAGGHVSDLAARLGLGVPLGQELNVAGGDINAILAAQQVFKQNLQAEGQAAQVEAALGEGRKAIDGVGAVAGGKDGPAGEAVACLGTHWGETFLSAVGGWKTAKPT